MSHVYQSNNPFSQILSVPSHTPHLFEVSLIAQHTTPGESASIEGDIGDKAWYLASKIDIPGYSLEFTDRHPVLRETYVRGVQLPNELSITWFETEDLQVWNYHRRWMECFYDRRTDRFVAGPKGKLRYAKVFLHKNEPGTDRQLKFGRDLTEESSLHIFEIRGLKPANIAPLSFDWTATSSPVFTYRYKYDRILYRTWKDQKEGNIGVDIG